MKRVEHYCDLCGTQMTAQDCEDDTICFGIEVLAKKASESHTITAGMLVDVTTKNSSGHSSSRHLLHGTEFCSFECFYSSMMSLIDRVRPAFIKKAFP